MGSLDIKRFASLSAQNSLIVLAALAIYALFLNTVYPMLDLSFLANLNANLVYSLQRLFGVPVELDGTTLFYTTGEGSFYIEIIPECTAVIETLMFIILLAVFRGAGRNAKIRGVIIFVPVIFIENIIRLSTLYAIASYFGIDFMFAVHYHIWLWGQLLFVLALFSIWYMVFARHELLASLQHVKAGKKAHKKHNKSSRKKRKAK